MNNGIKLKEVFLSGFKSISKEGQTIPINDITVLIGANGAGKSNLVSFLSMLNEMMKGKLQFFVGENGSSNSFLFYGFKHTRKIKASLYFTSDNESYEYDFSLKHAAGDTLIFSNEKITVKENNKTLIDKEFDSGGKESEFYKNLNSIGGFDVNDLTTMNYTILELKMKSLQVYQFHDTSKNSGLRNSVYINDNRYLHNDAGNLAAFLYALKNKPETIKYYNRIIRTIQQIMPQFDDFELNPSVLNHNYIILNWKEKNSDFLFGPHQISDGTLRFMALATLLLQPEESSPSTIILDEPELGLHPSAISALAGMVKTASQNCQVILATQSTRLVDEFSPENIIIAERDTVDKKSKFKKLQKKDLNKWLKEYSMSELWEKNIFGGKP
ncbi:MAG: AAA family ATPase [Bacteroidales bacterium]|nr:AAA family ATPase [Bacteroidales bacterium]